MTNYYSTIETNKDTNKFRGVVLNGANNERVFVSEEYTSQAQAQHAISTFLSETVGAASVQDAYTNVMNYKQNILNAHARQKSTRCCGR